MAQLKDLLVDIVKVDQSFITGLADDPTDQAIVATIIGLGHALDVEVVAEGIETPEDLRALVALGASGPRGSSLGPGASRRPRRRAHAGGIDLNSIEGCLPVSWQRVGERLPRPARAGQLRSVAAGKVRLVEDLGRYTEVEERLVAQLLVGGIRGRIADEPVDQVVCARGRPTTGPQAMGLDVTLAL